MKIFLLGFGIWIFKFCFGLIAENPAGSLWLVPVVFIVGLTVALVGLKMIWEKL